MEASRDAWRNAHGDYAWEVDLRHFAERQEYPGFFSRVIGSRDAIRFEDAFRRAIDGSGTYQIAGEVCYWKNYGNHQSRDRITRKLLQLLSDKECWAKFRGAVKEVCKHPCFPALACLQDASGQPHGFATLLTFVSFYDPTSFPMVDKYIAYWWAASKKRFGLATLPSFSQRDDGWIETTTKTKTELNWGAYMAWTRFCRDYAQRLGGWRARDVEMAVWMAQKRGKDLPTLRD